MFVFRKNVSKELFLSDLKNENGLFFSQSTPFNCGELSCFCLNKTQLIHLQAVINFCLPCQSRAASKLAICEKSPCIFQLLYWPFVSVDNSSEAVIDCWLKLYL
jgi:hypothetical protein